MNTGAPIIAVSTDNGSSITLIVLDSVSMIIIKLAPRLILTGTTYLLLLPTSILAQCGISSPIHPTCPHIDTADAVIRVDANMNTIRVFFISIPLAFASSSLNASILSLHLKRYIITIPTIINGEPIIIFSYFALVKLPISQYVISGSLSCGSAVYFNSEPIALKSEEAIRRMLEEENVICEPADIGVPAYYISGYDYIESLSAFREGYIQVQDISSMLVGKIADPAQDNYVIDVCAAPGGKSLHIADLLKDTGCVEARDLTMQKVMLIKENIERCHANNVVAVVKDALELDETAIDKADIVICDLPCSGLGIIGRKADIKYKVDEEKIEQLANLQREILKVVQNYVKPGGCLIFSTCTVNQTENDENVRWFEENYGFELESIEEYLPEKFRNRTGDRGYIQIFPKAGENDGFFISKFRRKKV